MGQGADWARVMRQARHARRCPVILRGYFNRASASELRKEATQPSSIDPKFRGKKLTVANKLLLLWSQVSTHSFLGLLLHRLLLPSWVELSTYRHVDGRN